MALILSERNVRDILTMSEGVRLVEEAFRLHAQGRATLGPRVAMPLAGEAGSFRVMAASLPDVGTFGLKTLTGIAGKRRSRETYFVVLIFDAATGAFSAMVPAMHITSIRTGAAGGVAAKYLARPEARVLGVIGAGVQARAQVEAISVVRPIQRVKVFDLDPERATDLAARVKATGIEAQIVNEARQAVAGSDIVVCATTSTRPVALGAWLEKGVHVNAIGANSPAKRELDAEAFQKATLTLDFREQAVSEAGDLMEVLASGALPRSATERELGNVIAGRIPGRQSSSEISVFKSVGVAFQDIAVAAWVCHRAAELGTGVQVELEHDAG